MDLGSTRSRRREQRLKRLSQKARLDPKRVLASKEYWRPDFCHRFLEYCAESAYYNPAGAVALAFLGVRLAKRTGDPSSKAHAFGVLGSAYRLLGQPEKSRRCFEIAATHTKDDPYCLADLTRRRVALQACLCRFDEALELADQAIELYRKVGKPNGIGRGVLYRGIVLLRMGKLGEALTDFQHALELLSPAESDMYYTAALHNITLALAKGSSQQVTEALSRLQKVKKALKGKPDLHLLRVKLRWTEGLLFLRQDQYLRGRRRLESVKDALLKLGLPAEVAAITADLASTYHPNFRGLKQVVENTLRRQPFEPDISSLFQKVIAAATAERDSVLELLAAIRQAVSHPSMPAVVPAAV